MEVRFIPREGTPLKRYLDEARAKRITIPNALHDLATAHEAYREVAGTAKMERK